MQFLVQWNVAYSTYLYLSCNVFGFVAFSGIQTIMSALEIDGGDEIANGASNLYRV